MASNHELQLPGILIKDQILKGIAEESLKFAPPLDSFQAQSHSVDLRLSSTFLIPKRWVVTDKGREALVIDYLDKIPQFDTVQLERGQYFELLPREWVTASTLETITMPDDLMAIMFPRSSISRRGLSLDSTGIIDAGYEGTLLVPIENKTDQVIRLHPGQRFCQLIFLPLSQSIPIVLSRWHKKDVIVGGVGERDPIEEQLIASGQIKQLKQDFPLQLPISPES